MAWAAIYPEQSLFGKIFGHIYLNCQNVKRFSAEDSNSGNFYLSLSGFMPGSTVLCGSS